MRGPSMYAPTEPATPALMCTTVPPAKSSAPSLKRETVACPHHVRERQVGEGEPDRGEQQHRGELRALGDRTDDQRAADRAKAPWNAT
jgi:hypothetical protein